MAENRRWCAPAPDHSPAYNRDLVAGDPNGTRTRVFAVKGRRPRPLDDGAVRLRPGPLSRMDGARSSTLLRLLFHALQSAQAASSRCISACVLRSEEHTSELQLLMRTSYPVFCLRKERKRTRWTSRH